MIQLSVIIPTYNRAEQLRRCLEALAHQTQPPQDYEVIVVIDGATDVTQTMLAHLPLPYTLRVIWQENSGQGTARNRGVQAAVAPYCLLLDDDIVAAPTLIAAHLRVQREQAARNGSVAGLGQLTMTLPADADWFARCFAKTWRNHYAALNTGKRSPSYHDCYSANVSIARADYLAVGGFSPDLNESCDVEFGYRLTKLGLSFVYIPDAVGEHEDYKDFRRLVVQTERQGKAAVELCRRHPALLSELLHTPSEHSLPRLLLHHILLAVNLPPRYLGFIGAWLGQHPWAYLWYLALSTYSFWRGVQQAMPDSDSWRRLTYNTPILLYHAVGAPNEPPSRYVAPIKRFAQQLAWLQRLGYHPLSLEEYICYRRAHQLPPAGAVVITLDDGYADNYIQAYPALVRYGFNATFFVVSGCIGGANQWDSKTELVGRPLLDEAALHALRQGGMQIGAHTCTHAHLPSLPGADQQAEIEESRAKLACTLQMPIPVFAYPYGEFTETTQSLVEAAGFTGACGIRSGRNTLRTPLYALRRTEIYGTDSLVHFMLKLWFGRAPTLFRRRGSH